MSRAGRLSRGLGWRLRATRRVWRRETTAEMSMLPRGVPLPDGRLDAPAPGSVLPRAPLTIEGWAMFPSGPPARVEIWLGDEPLGRARLGLARGDVRAMTEDARGAVSGFELIADFDRFPGADAPLRAIATGLEGERLELDPVAVRVSAAPLEHEAQARPGVRRRPTGERRRLLIFAHQLDLGGAQTYLSQMIGGLLRLGTIEPTVLSAMDGPLRAELEELGVPVHVSTPVPQDEYEGHLDRVEELTAWAAGGGFDAVLVNTASAFAFPGAEVAARLGLPAIWAIHESLPPSILWEELNPGVRQLATTALSEAALAVFEAEATRRIFEPIVGAERCVTMPYGLELEPIDRSRTGFDRTEARREVGLHADAEVLLCAGTVEPRKAQVPLAQAFDLIAGRHPRAQLVFVGGRSNEHSRLLGGWIASLNSADRIRMLPMTPEIHTWYGVSDVLVCASDIESLPRTALEAMAWERPVVATSVFGLPELIDDGETGWLCDDRDVDSMAVALDRALSTPAEERAKMGDRARRVIESRHRIDSYCEEFAELVDRIASAPASQAEVVKLPYRA